MPSFFPSSSHTRDAYFDKKVVIIYQTMEKKASNIMANNYDHCHVKLPTRARVLIL